MPKKLPHIIIGQSEEDSDWLIAAVRDSELELHAKIAEGYQEWLKRLAQRLTNRDGTGKPTGDSSPGGA